MVHRAGHALSCQWYAANVRSRPAGRESLVTAHKFGGSWTETKLECLRKYLNAYRKIFTQNQRARYFKTWYVDAFASTGSRLISKSAPPRVAVAVVTGVNIGQQSGVGILTWTADGGEVEEHRRSPLVTAATAHQRGQSHTQGDVGTK